jgi:hypothetical protein
VNIAVDLGAVGHRVHSIIILLIHTAAKQTLLFSRFRCRKVAVAQKEGNTYERELIADALLCKMKFPWDEIQIWKFRTDGFGSGSHLEKFP